MRGDAGAPGSLLFALAVAAPLRSSCAPQWPCTCACSAAKRPSRPGKRTARARTSHASSSVDVDVDLGLPAPCADVERARRRARDRLRQAESLALELSRVDASTNITAGVRLTYALVLRVLRTPYEGVLDSRMAARCIRVLTSVHRALQGRRMRRHKDHDDAKLWRSRALLIESWALRTERVMHCTDEVGLSIFVHSLGVLNATPGNAFLQAWESQFGRLENARSFQALSNSIWGLAKLNQVPRSADFWDAWLTRFSALITHAKPQELANIVYALGRLGVDTLSEPIQISRSHTNRKGSSASALTIAGLMRASGFMETFQDAFVQGGHAFNAQELANTLWAVVMLESPPSKSFWKVWLSQFHVHASSFKPKELACTANALGKLVKLHSAARRVFVSVSDMNHLWCRWETCFSRSGLDFSSQELAVSLWAFTVLRYHRQISSTVGVAFMEHWAFCFEQTSGNFSGLELANVMWSFGRLHSSCTHIRAGSSQSNTHNEDRTGYFDASLSDMDAPVDDDLERKVRVDETVAAPPAFQRVLSGSEARLLPAGQALRPDDFFPTQDLIEDWMCAFMELPGNAMNSHSIALTLHGLGQMLIVPDALVLDRILLFCNKNWPSFKSQELASLMWSFGRLSLSLPMVTIREWNAHFLARMDEHNSQELSNALWGLARSRVGVPVDFLSAWIARAEAVMLSFKQQELVSSLWALARLSMAGKVLKRPPPSFLEKYSLVFKSQLDLFKSKELVTILWSWSVLGVSPYAGFSRDVETALASRGALDRSTARRVERALSVLKQAK
ncbi:hypothetical protein FVE85_7714 [Porphyridium purpureum]|uniref:Tbc2 translation factor, chloroplastic n=1 Tax=Porphyridium purpureum TaxID=35688 RepID=A0A5J4YKZ9_PORPP|nr:hypothetical protein FVE85_7714 [Porphyridium purpureum]|eukprot:POR8095..scf210_14